MPCRPGDILFFTAPPQPNRFAKLAMRAQWFLSCLSCACCTEDYKKTHVAVCTAVAEDKNGNQEVTIAHFNSQTYQYQQETLTRLSNSLKDRRVDILRPHNSEFAKSLAATITSEEAHSVQLDNDSMKRSLSCCACADIEKTKSGFSLRTHCSRFIAEAIDITSHAPGNDYSDYSFKGANVTVMRLWQRLTTAKLYEHIPPTASEEKLNTKTIHSEKQALLF